MLAESFLAFTLAEIVSMQRFIQICHFSQNFQKVALVILADNIGIVREYSHPGKNTLIIIFTIPHTVVNRLAAAVIARGSRQTFC